MEVIVPSAGLTDHAADVVAPAAIAANCWLCPAVKVMVCGETVSGTSVTTAEADAPETVAVIVTTWPEESEIGAVYRPVVVIVPAGGFTDQAAEELLTPPTAALNCSACPAARLTVCGAIVNGTSVIVDEADPPETVAVTVTT